MDNLLVYRARFGECYPYKMATSALTAFLGVDPSEQAVKTIQTLLLVACGEGKDALTRNSIYTPISLILACH